jgi:hypothetical protein
MSNQSRSVASIVAVALAGTTASTFAQAPENDWSVEVTPYIWAAGIDGDITIGGLKASVDLKFDDLIDAVDMAGAVLGLVRYNRFVTWVQLDYVGTDTDELDADDQPARGRVETDMVMGTLAFGYAFGDPGDPYSLDLLLGARSLSLDNELTIDGRGQFKHDKSYVDPVLIALPSFRISERWRFNPALSIGGGGDSEFVYELQPQVQFQINDFLAARFGYRTLHYKIESDVNTNEFDGAFQGLLIGVGGTFGNGR